MIKLNSSKDDERDSGVGKRVAQAALAGGTTIIAGKVDGDGATYAVYCATYAGMHWHPFFCLVLWDQRRVERRVCHDDKVYGCKKELR